VKSRLKRKARGESCLFEGVPGARLRLQPALMQAAAIP
jgi:hypothetical protein